MVAWLDEGCAKEDKQGWFNDSTLEGWFNERS